MKSGIVLARPESPRTQQSFVSTRSTCYPISVSARRIVQCSKGFRVLRKASARLPQLRHTRDSARPAKSHKEEERDRKSTRLNSSHGSISYAVFCLKKKM